MVGYICFNTTSSKIKGSFIKDGESHSIILESRRKINIKEGDIFVLLQHMIIRDDYLFTDTGKILNTELKSTSEDGVNEYSIQYVVEKTTENYLALSDLQYSLLKVYRYDQPYKHFAFSYVYMDQFDYETIITGRIFLSRTAFGKIINSLPDDHKNEYFITLVRKMGVRIIRSLDYLSALELLNVYIKEEIENQGRLMIATAKLLEENLQDYVDISEIGFIDEEDRQPDYLMPQVQLFINLFQQADMQTLISEFGEDEMQSRIEKIFNEKFIDIEWPLYYEEKH